ncbi:MAG: sulfite reductase, ferredoxin dependent [Cyanobacteria bacterium P01_C01_bin.89]
MVQSPSLAVAEQKVSRLEHIKEDSQFLLEPVASELLEDTDHFSRQAIQILKFHGSYQQSNRDDIKNKKGKSYQMMLRTRNPGGYIPPQLYLALDDMADEYGVSNLRATTRQGFQLHGILKKNLKAAIQRIVANLGSTLGACGDLNRNVMAPPAPYKNRPEYEYALTYANNIADLLTPQTGAYYEIWLDGEKAVSLEEDPAVVAAREGSTPTLEARAGVEPIYGTHYMPRKFKCAVTVPGDNSVDLFSQDVGLVVIVDSDGNLEGFNVYAGGGLGRTHNKEETFARVADPIGFVGKDDVYELVKAVVATQRDYGDRVERRHARMKYLIHDWGVDKFRDTVEGYFGKVLDPIRETPPFEYRDFLGWHEQGDGRYFLGISVENGRVKDEGDFKLRSALREIVETFYIPMLVTPQQNVLIYDIEAGDREKINKILKDSGVMAVEEIDPLVRRSMACPALPTCGLAITESERALPSILDRVRSLMTKVGLEDEHFVVRMTGCPNGCARPYLAELALVGSGSNAYQVWLGGAPNHTRLARPIVQKLKDPDLESFLEPIFVYFKRSRQGAESFGDFCDRVGFDTLMHFIQVYKPSLEDQQEKNPQDLEKSLEAPAAQLPTPTRKRHRVGVQDDVYASLKQLAADRNQPVTALVNDVLAAYLETQKR